jgi:hypothetical protein
MGIGKELFTNCVTDSSAALARKVSIAIRAVVLSGMRERQLYVGHFWVVNRVDKRLLTIYGSSMVPAVTKRPAAKLRMQPTALAVARSPAVVAAQLTASHDRAWLREVVNQLDVALQRGALERLITLWGISSAEAAGFFGVSRQAFAKWLQAGPPADRAPAIAALEDATELLARHLKRERIPAVVRRASALTGERSLLQMATAGEHEQILSAVRAMFDLRRVQP